MANYCWCVSFGDELLFASRSVVLFPLAVNYSRRQVFYNTNTILDGCLGKGYPTTFNGAIKSPTCGRFFFQLLPILYCVAVHKRGSIEFHC